MPGYPGTPLAQKLGLTPQLTLLTIDAPREYRRWLGDLPDGVRLVTTATGARGVRGQRRLVGVEAGDPQDRAGTLKARRSGTGRSG
jgi:hypothetical protein